MSHYYSDASNSYSHYGAPLRSGGRQGQPSYGMVQPTSGMPTAWSNMPAHHRQVTALHSAPPVIQRPPTTPPSIMTPEMAEARMFGQVASKAKGASKKFGLLRRKSTGDPSPPAMPSGSHHHNPIDPINPLLQHQHQSHNPINPTNPLLQGQHYSRHPIDPTNPLLQGQHHSRAPIDPTNPLLQGQHHSRQPIDHTNPLIQNQHHGRHPMDPQIPLQQHHPQPSYHPDPLDNGSIPVQIPNLNDINELARSLGITEAVDNLRNAIASASAPIISEAARAAISILAIVANGVRGTKVNDINLKSLAGHACTLISYIVVTQQQREREGRGLERGLVEDLNNLLKVLYDVQAFLIEQSKRSRLSKAVTYKTDAQRLNDQRETLSQALAEFQFRSSISRQDHVAQIDKRLEEIKRNMVETRAKSPGRPVRLPPNFPQLNPATTRSRPPSRRA